MILSYTYTLHTYTPSKLPHIDQRVNFEKLQLRFSLISLKNSGARWPRSLHSILGRPVSQPTPKTEEWKKKLVSLLLLLHRISTNFCRISHNLSCWRPLLRFLSFLAYRTTGWSSGTGLRAGNCEVRSTEVISTPSGCSELRSTLAMDSSSSCCKSALPSLFEWSLLLFSWWFPSSSWGGEWPPVSSISMPFLPPNRNNKTHLSQVQSTQKMMHTTPLLPFNTLTCISSHSSPDPKKSPHAPSPSTSTSIKASSGSKETSCSEVLTINLFHRHTNGVKYFRVAECGSLISAPKMMM